MNSKQLTLSTSSFAMLMAAFTWSIPASAQEASLAIDRGESTVIRASLDDDAPATASLYDETATSSLYDASLASWGGEADCDAKGGSKGYLDCDEPGCGTNCGCAGCFRAALRSRGFGSFEYLHWYSKDRSYPPLVTTSPQGTAGVLAGRMDQADTTVLFGNDEIGGDLQAGARLTLGMWLDDCEDRAVVFRFYANQGESESYSASSNGDPILAIPYNDTNPLVNSEAAFLVAFPGLSTGTINASATTDVLGGDFYGRTLFDEGCNYRVDLMAGYQFNRIDDELLMNSVTTAAGPTVVTLNDMFDVHNEYHAGTVGLLTEIYDGCWTLSMMGKIGIGNMNQQVTINGNYSAVGGGAPGAGAGGLFAQPTNIGVYQRDVTVYAPEVNFKVSYAVNDRLSVSVGYSFLYWTSVVLAGDTIDRDVNSTQLTGGALAGPADPEFTWRDTDYWVQTVDIGGSFAY